LISHNLGVPTLVLGLVGRASETLIRSAGAGIAALAVFDFDVDISAGIRPDMVRYLPSAGELVGFTRPKI
tara:strand:- start:181 stop:390 length:210 start_codon:yes stop_codon:yes gene_type:complete